MTLHTTEIRVANIAFSGEMSRMRTWLDSQHFEPATFRYNHVDGAVVIRVEFSAEQEADAFAREFGGRMLR